MAPPFFFMRFFVLHRLCILQIIPFPGPLRLFLSGTLLFSTGNTFISARNTFIFLPGILLFLPGIAEPDLKLSVVKGPPA